MISADKTEAPEPATKIRESAVNSSVTLQTTQDATLSDPQLRDQSAAETKYASMENVLKEHLLIKQQNNP